MIIPSVDVKDGEAVQLVEGKEVALRAGDPRPIIDQYGIAGDVAVIDLDAALGQGENTDVIKDLLQRASCRVGGGIRSVEAAREWLDAGADQIILGTAAKPEILEQLPSERVIAALDAEHGEVVVEGWTEKTGETILDRMERLKDYVGGFLITFVEHEGHLEGTAMDQVEKLVDVAGSADVTIAGGISTTDEIAELDQKGADAQVGMALYTDKIHLGDALTAPLTSDRSDDLWPTVVSDRSGHALGLAYSSAESVREAIDRQRGVYQSRSRGLWVKGETSGATQELVGIDVDCDRDALRFRVKQDDPGFCHTDSWSCWNSDWNLSDLERIIQSRREDAPEDSYTNKLFQNPDLLEEKLLEEAGELAEADSFDEVQWEAADLMYFLLAAMAEQDVTLADVEQELERRH